MNERLTQHCNNETKESPKQSKLVQHVLECKCKVKPKEAKPIGERPSIQIGREIWEAYLIKSGGTNVISEPSISLLDIEFNLLDKWAEKKKK
jgi:hypothetical protein